MGEAAAVSVIQAMRLSPAVHGVATPVPNGPAFNGAGRQAPMTVDVNVSSPSGITVVSVQSRASFVADIDPMMQAAEGAARRLGHRAPFVLHLVAQPGSELATRVLSMAGQLAAAPRVLVVRRVGATDPSAFIALGRKVVAAAPVRAVAADPLAGFACVDVPTIVVAPPPACVAPGHLRNAFVEACFFPGSRALPVGAVDDVAAGAAASSAEFRRGSLSTQEPFNSAAAQHLSDYLEVCVERLFVGAWCCCGGTASGFCGCVVAGTHATQAHTTRRVNRLCPRHRV